MGFVHTHVHSEYSLLDGASKIKDIVRKVKDAGMDACALTDHGVAYGLVEFYDECKKNGIKPILGCEVYEAPGSRFEKSGSVTDDRYFHLILLVKNQTGYENLCHLISRSNTEGFYYKPRIDFELLKQFHEGLICQSACLAGRIPSDILRGDLSSAREDIQRYKDLFGDDFYLEIMNHGIEEERRVAYALRDLSREMGVKLVCSNDSHYVNSEDAEAHEWLLCLQTQKKITDQDRLIYEGDYSLKTEEEMRRLFPDIPEAFDNTVEISKKCNFDFVYNQYKMPAVTIPQEYGTDFFGYLSDETWKGFEKRYPDGSKHREEAKERIKYELSIVEQMNFAEYFLDTRKTVLWAKNNNILVGPGRGSAAGSVMVYCLGITDIEPIEYGLLFERFLNPERVSMPDIDVDYEYSRKDDVIRFEAESNGYDHFAKIITFQTLAAKGVLRDLVRVAGLPVQVGDRLARMIPNDPKITLKGAWEMNPELEETIESDPELKKIWEIALKLEGTNKAASTHACGHVPTAVPCEDRFPVSVDQETGYLVCQYNMTQVEHLGNLKKDLLMLRNLTIITIAQEAIKKNHGVDVPLWNDRILNDENALRLFSSGDTNGIFQFESDGMTNFMRQLKPTCFEDIIAGVALYRPGPMDFIPDYINGKHDPKSVKYLTPQLEPILKATYGVIVYQEQVMQIVQKLAGFSMGRADLLRKAMGKKKQDIMDEEETNFVYGSKELGIPGCVENGIPEEIAHEIYGQMKSFAQYAFNKSHAAAYAAIAMQTAYLKANYPLEFAAGLLTSVMDKTDKLVAYKADYDKRGLRIQKPDINTSGTTFTVSGDSILYGLASIKGAGEEDIKSVIDERERGGEYRNFPEFLKRNSKLSSRVAEALIKAGAMDSIAYSNGITRRSMILSFKTILDSYRKEEKEQIKGQMTLFDLPMFKGKEEEYGGYCTVPKVDEFTKKDIYRMEKEATGFYISGHPLDEYDKHLKEHECTPLYELQEDSPLMQGGDKYLNIAGIVTQKKVVYTKKDQRAMAFITLSDRDASVDVTVFPDKYQMMGSLFDEDSPIMMNVQIKHSPEHGTSLLMSEAMNLSGKGMNLWVGFDSAQAYAGNCKTLDAILDRNKGGINDVVIFLKDTKQVLVRHNYHAGDRMRMQMEDLFGSGNVAEHFDAYPLLADSKTAAKKKEI